MRTLWPVLAISAIITKQVRLRAYRCMSRNAIFMSPNSRAARARPVSTKALEASFSSSSRNFSRESSRVKQLGSIAGAAVSAAVALDADSSVRLGSFKVLSVCAVLVAAPRTPQRTPPSRDAASTSVRAEGNSLCIATSVSALSESERAPPLNGPLASIATTAAAALPPRGSPFKMTQMSSATQMKQNSEVIAMRLNHRSH